MKKILFIHFILFLFFFLNIENIFALQITKIIYDKTDKDSNWFEIFNDGSNINNFAKGDYQVCVSTSDPTKCFHEINSEYISSITNLPINSYAAIVGDALTFKNNNPDYKGLIFDSSFDLNNTNGYVAISLSKNIIVCKEYGTGICPQVNSTNNSPSTDNNSASTTTDSISVNNTSSDSPNIVYVYVPTNNQNKYGDITVLLPEEKLIPAGADSEFSIKVIDQDKKPVTGLDFQWSFGDGGEKFGQKVTHHYSYPGEYTLVASADGYTVGGEAKMKVKVVVPDVSISKVGSEDKENYIDLTNNTDYDLVLSNFYLDLDNNFYKLPKNFTISKKQTAHVSGEAVGFTLPATNISLNYPNKNLLISYLNKNDAEKTNPDSKIDSTSIYKAYSVATDINIKNIPQVQDILEEKITQPIKVEEVKSETKPQKIESLKLKRLILNSDDKKLNSSEDKSVNLNKNGDVDTGIVNWLKTLIY